MKIWTVALVMCLPVLPGNAQYSGGSGTVGDPYRIATAAELIALGERPEDYGKHFILTADIDLDPSLPGRKVFDRAVIAPDMNDVDYGLQGTAFTGVFDGDQHTIANLKIAGTSHLGLFGQLGPTAVVNSLTLVNVDIVASDMFVGSLAGYSLGSIVTSDCMGSIQGYHYVGGLVGENVNGCILLSHSSCTVSAEGNLGGLAGGNYGTILSSSSKGTVSGNSHYIGGLVGDNNLGGSVCSSYSTAKVSGSWGVGGLVGQNAGAVANSYSAGEVYGGGLVGIGSVEGISNCFWDINASGRASSSGGRGLATVRMQDINTFLNAGWDLVGETFNGTCDYWEISAGDYPRLRYHAGASPMMPPGLGTVEEPYLIRDVRDLGTVWSKPSAHYRLEASLDLSEITWTHAVIPWFGGTLGGNACVISNLRIEGGGYLGLFGQLSSGSEITNLSLEMADVQGTGNCIGSLAGESDGFVDGLCSTGQASGNECVGGLVGSSSGRISGSHNASASTGNRRVGGLVGYNGRGSITECSNIGMVAGNGPSSGGLVGEALWGNISSSYNAGKVSGDQRVGGLVGYNQGSQITNSYCTGTVEGSEEVGGLVGYNSGGCIPEGSSTAGNNGAELTSISSSYSAATVHGLRVVGGLVGKGGNAGVISCLWDVDISGQTRSAGGTGLTTAEMQTASTFLEAGWDFIDETENGIDETENGIDDIWWMLEGQDYPRLWWEFAGEDVMQ